MIMNEILYNAGLGLLTLGLVGGSLAGIMLLRAGKRLQKLLKAEYGEERHV